MRAPRPDATSLRLFLLTWCLAALVSPGHFGSVDADRRLQVARSWWTAEPEVRADDVDFGIPGRAGERRAWYGPGQSLVLLVPDMAAAALVRVVPTLARLNAAADRAVTGGIVAVVVGPTLAAVAAVLAFRLLLLLGFDRVAAAAGAMALVAATSFLHYAQTLQENTLMLALTLGGFTGALQWVRDGSRRSLVFASACLGFNLLVRLTTLLDAAAVLTCAAALVWQGKGDRRARLRQLASVAVPTLAAFVLIDRLYHFLRFGEWTTTYIGLFGVAARAVDPSLPPSFPFSGAFFEGFVGVFFSAHKSVFLFDPLLIVVVACACVGWRVWPFPLRLFVTVMSAVGLGLVVFYARYYNWGGDAAWGDRFVVSAVQPLAMLAVPLLMRSSQAWPLRRVLWCVVAVGVVVQLASAAFSFNLEIAQGHRGSGSSFVVGQRFVNVWHAAVGRNDPDAQIRPMFEPAFGPFAWPEALGPGVTTTALTVWWVLLATTVVQAWGLVEHLRRGLPHRRSAASADG